MFYVMRLSGMVGGFLALCFKARVQDKKKVWQIGVFSSLVLASLPIVSPDGLYAHPVVLTESPGQ